MKRLRKLALYAAATIAIAGLTFAIPFTEHLDGPTSAVLADSPVGTTFGLSVLWYDRGLNSAKFHRELDFTSPDKMRLAQNSTETAGCVTFRVSVLPDESKFEERIFAPTDVIALLADARVFTGKGNLPIIDPDAFGPVLREINPVRAQTYNGALLLWMGGKVGYAVVPDSDGCPLINRASAL